MEEAQPEIHACGQCGDKFDTEEQYLDHGCKATGFTPRDPEHLGPDFADVQKEAMERGNKRKASE